MFLRLSVVGLGALSLVALVSACETVRITQKPPGNGRTDGGSDVDGAVGEDAAVDEDAGNADAGGPPKYDLPTQFKRTINCEVSPGLCSAGACSNNFGVNCGLQSPCRGKTSLLELTNVAEFPVKLRTPKLTAADPGCTTLCGPGSATKFAISLQIKTAGQNLPLAIKVPPPWKISVGEDRYGPIYCSAGGDPLPAYAGVNCIGYYGSGNASLAIVTDDANAPAVDVVIDTLQLNDWPADFDGQCPYK